MSSGRPPGPDGLPGLGNTLQFVRDPVGFYGVCAEYGDVVRARIGREDLYVVSHPDLIRQVLVDDAANYRRLDSNPERAGVFDVGMALVAGNRWRHPRSTPPPLFDTGYVPEYATATVRHAETMAALWDDGEVVAVDEAMRELALDVFIDVLFGVDVDHRQRLSDLGGAVGEPGSGDTERLRAAVHAFDEAVDTRSPSGLVPGWVPTRPNRQYRRALAEFEHVVDEVVERRRASDDDGSHDVLSTLLRVGSAGRELDEVAIRDRLVRTLVAGHETTAAALTFTAHALATHPGVADRLRAEVDAVLGPRSAAAEDRPALGYTKRVVTESLRRYPPLYATVRRPTRTAELATYEIPADTTVVTSQYVVHNDPRWYTAPETFRPERWATWDGPEYAYFPFGGGERAGEWARFVVQELQLVVATMAQQVTFDPVTDDPLELRFGATLAPKDGLDLVVRERVATPRN
ncbi:cytochrome P450 [Halomarina oriensis]|uniref:Cytochrome P450 n=1 Tax=Halomarina oriensis TaxID=671145 RepID=A0A6B0GIN7_9EURY|nr:cytochrome P450 [Halomarina oriensis]MWG33671.1 cytochrome P450 [Halomarina oriensis]